MAAAVGGLVLPPTVHRIVAHPEEFAVDFEWLVQLARLLEEQPIVDQAAVLDSLAKLSLLLPAGHFLEVHALRRNIDCKRTQWEAAHFLQLRGVPCSFTDQVMMIYANTLQDPPVFKTMGEVMRDPERTTGGAPSDKVLAMLPYVKALDTGLQALSRLPAFKYAGDAFRGMRYSYGNDLLDRFKVGCEVFWYEPRSATCNRDLMWHDEFCGVSGPRTIFVLSNVEGALIRELSEYQMEDEVLMRPLTRFRVTKSVRQSGTGDPFKTADLVYMEMLPGSSAGCSLADILVMAANDITAKRGLTTLKEQLPSKRAGGDCGARLALVGPTKAGKSTFVNAFFSGVLVPSGTLPNTILPAVLLSDPDHASYSVELHGVGLQQALEATVSNLKLDSLSIGEAAKVLHCLNQAVRDLAESPALDDYNPLQLREWSLNVRLPGPRVGCAVVDCPGGNEKGKAGEFIQLVLSFQVECAVAVAFIVAADNIMLLQDDAQMLECLGGPVVAQAARHSVVVVSKVKEGDENDCHRFLQKEDVQKNIAKMLPGAGTPFLVSGRSILTCGILQRMTSLPSWSEIDPEKQADMEYVCTSLYQKCNQRVYDSHREDMREDAYEMFVGLKDNARVFDDLRRALASWPSRLAASCLKKQELGVELALAKLQADVKKEKMSRTDLEQKLRLYQGIMAADKLELLRQSVKATFVPLQEALKEKFGRVGGKLRDFALDQVTWEEAHALLRKECGEMVAWAFRFNVPPCGPRIVLSGFLLSRALYLWVVEEAKRSNGLFVGAAQQAGKDWVHQQLHTSSSIEPGEHEAIIPSAASSFDYSADLLPGAGCWIATAFSDLLDTCKDLQIHDHKLEHFTSKLGKDLEFAAKERVGELEQSLQEALSSNAPHAERLEARARDMECTRDEVCRLLAVARSRSEQ